MSYQIVIGKKTYQFQDLKQVLAKASPLRSGDELSGIAAADQKERIAAQMVLADIYLSDFLNVELIPSDIDEVTRLILTSHDKVSFQTISHLTVGGFRDFLLSETTDAQVLESIRMALTPEMVAAVSKLMSN